MFLTSLQLTRVLHVIGLVLLYYPFSIGLTFYQKWFIKQLRLPLSIVLVHYVVKWAGAAALRAALRWRTGVCRVSVAAGESARQLAPVGVAAAVDIGLSNWSMEFITVSLYTMSKSTVVVFILLFAVCAGLESLRCSTALIVALIAGGLFLFTFHAEQFSAEGFMLVELAALCSGIRWVQSQFLMQRQDMGLHNPVDMIYHVQPWMILTMIPLVLVFEGHSYDFALLFANSDPSIIFRLGSLTFLGGCIALCMELSEYLLLVHTSGLTLSVCGILKEVVTLVLAHYVNGDSLSSLNLVGLTLCLCGITLHAATRLKAEQPAKTDLRPTSIELKQRRHLISSCDSDSD